MLAMRLYRAEGILMTASINATPVAATPADAATVANAKPVLMTMGEALAAHAAAQTAAAAAAVANPLSWYQTPAVKLAGKTIAVAAVVAVGYMVYKRFTGSNASADTAVAAVTGVVDATTGA